MRKLLLEIDNNICSHQARSLSLTKLHLRPGLRRRFRSESLQRSLCRYPDTEKRRGRNGREGVNREDGKKDRDERIHPNTILVMSLG